MYAQWTVTALKRHLKLHSQSTSGKKAELVKRCEKHEKKCHCRLLSGDDGDHVTPNELSVEDLSSVASTIKWTESLKDWPTLNHSCIHAFKASDKHNRQGYNLFKSDKVENMLAGTQGDRYYCKGRVSPSMKKMRYTAMLKIEGACVRESDCSCPAGKGKCKHAVALLYLLVDHLMSGREKISESLACTSQPRQWGRVSAKPVVADFLNFSEMVPRVVDHDPDNPNAAVVQSLRAESQLNYSCLPANTPACHTARKDTLTMRHPFWRSIFMAGAEQETTSCCVATPLPHRNSTTDTTDNPQAVSTDFIPPVANIQPASTASLHSLKSEVCTSVASRSVVDSKSNTQAFDWGIDADLFHEPAPLTSNVTPVTHDPDYDTMRIDLEKSTRGQGDNSKWTEARRGKITSSVIGAIYTMRETTKPDTLINQISTTTDLSHITAIRHGQLHEKDAKAHYEKTWNVTIEDRGFTLHPIHHWLGASTDGFISNSNSPSVVEIKCPLGDQGTTSIMDFALKRKNWFLDTDGVVIWLKKNHKYYYQCQIQMECLDVRKCVFIAYLCDLSGKFQDVHSEYIVKDDKLVRGLISKAQRFYNKYLKC